MKKCTICGEEKDETHFYKDKSNPDGLERRCRKCNSIRAKKYRQENLEHCREICRKSTKKNYDSIRASQKAHLERNREKILKRRRELRRSRRDEINTKENARRKNPEFLEKSRIAQRKYYERTKEKQKPRKNAHKMVEYAVKLGIMIRSKICERCGYEGKLEGHHEDYSKPLEVQWLCRPCHSRHHNEIKDES